MDSNLQAAESAPSPVATLHNIELSVGSGLDEKCLLKNISLEIFSGEILAIIGPNGAGKSSLLRVLSGELNAQKGSVALHNKDLQTWPSEERAQHLACLPQQSELNFPYTVEEVVSLARLPHNTGKREDARIVASAIHSLELDKQAKQFYTQLSGGEQQRTQLARVLAQVWLQPAQRQQTQCQHTKPPLLLLDEPCRGLDPGHERQLIELISTFCKLGAAVVIVVHDINFASRYANRILALKEGRIFGIGTVEEMIKAPLLNELFDTQASVFAHPQLGYPVYL